MWPIPDLLHLLKNERDKSMNSDLYSDENSNHININSFKSIFSLKETTNDKSEIGTTKDSYVMDLFSIKTTIKSLIDENFSNVAFVLPFNLIIMALTSNRLPIQTRIKLLSKSFEFFTDYYKNYQDTSKGSLITAKC